MQHVVRFTTAEGRDGTHFSESLDEAVAFIERVRNVEDATEVRLFKMTEVPVSFKTYYHAQVGDVSEPTASPTVSPSLSPSVDESSSDSAATASALDAPAQEPTRPSSPTPSSSAEATSPPLENRFSDGSASQESAPTNGRRLFSRA